VFIVPVFIQLYRSKSSILLRRYPLGQNKYVMLFFGGWTFEIQLMQGGGVVLMMIEAI
jgi:hypothetical protein